VLANCPLSGCRLQYGRGDQPAPTRTGEGSRYFVVSQDRTYAEQAEREPDRFIAERRAPVPITPKVSGAILAERSPYEVAVTAITRCPLSPGRAPSSGSWLLASASRDGSLCHILWNQLSPPLDACPCGDVRGDSGGVRGCAGSAKTLTRIFSARLTLSAGERRLCWRTAPCQAAGCSMEPVLSTTGCLSIWRQRGRAGMCRECKDPDKNFFGWFRPFCRRMVSHSSVGTMTQRQQKPIHWVRF
jgi:hypothetical protein